jgi:hypothetical protein
MATAAIQPLVVATTEIIKDVKGFSRKHRARYFEYARERDRLLDRIAEARADHELDVEDEGEVVKHRVGYENLHSIVCRCNAGDGNHPSTKAALRDYLDSIDNHAGTSWTRHPLYKLEGRRKVKENERAARRLNEDLRDCEDVSTE